MSGFQLVDDGSDTKTNYKDTHFNHVMMYTRPPNPHAVWFSKIIVNKWRILLENVISSCGTVEIWQDFMITHCNGHSSGYSLDWFWRVEQPHMHLLIHYNNMFSSYFNYMHNKFLIRLRQLQLPISLVHIIWTQIPVFHLSRFVCSPNETPRAASLSSLHCVSLDRVTAAMVST